MKSLDEDSFPGSREQAFGFDFQRAGSGMGSESESEASAVAGTVVVEASVVAAVAAGPMVEEHKASESRKLEFHHH